MSAARRTRRSSRRTARKSGSPCAARTTSPCIDATTFAEKTRIDGAEPVRACRSSRPTANTATSARPSIRRRSWSPSPTTRSSRASSRRARSARTSPPRRTANQVWFTLKDIGKTQVFNARPPFNPIKTIETGPITNHVNFARTAKGTFAYVTIGGLNEVKVFRTDDFSQVATIPVGNLPHGVWPSGDGTRIYVGLENADALAAIDTATNKVVANIPIGQAPQAIAYVPGRGAQSGRPPESADPRRRRPGRAPRPRRRRPKRRAKSRRPASRCSIRA